jgi:MFS family permease
MRREQQSFLEQWSSPIGLCLTLFLVAYNINVVPTIMPHIVRDLNSSVGSILGALVLLPLVKASFAPTAENLIQRFGRRSIFIVGLWIFTIGILATCLSPNIGFFIISYSFITGVGASPLVGSPRDLIGRIYEGKAEKYGLLALIVFSILGGLTGAILGGWIASNYSWRWSFFPEILLVSVILILVKNAPTTPQRQTEALDWIGGLLSVSGFGLTLVGISLGSEYGWWTPKQLFKIFGIVIPPFALSIVPTLIAIGVACLGIFVFWERRQTRQGKVSLLQAGLFRRKSFLLALFPATLHYTITSGILFNLFQFLPLALNLNPYQTALTISPFSLASLVVVVYATFKIVGRVPAKFLIYFGLAIFCVGVWQLYNVVNLSLTKLSFLPALVIMGAGSGLFLAQISKTTFSTVTEEKMAEASGIYDSFENLGRALGRTILGTALIATTSIKIVDQVIEQLGRTISPAQRRTAIAVLEHVIQTSNREERADFLSKLPTTIQPSLDTILHTSTVGGMRTALFLGLVFSLLCLLSAFFIPKHSSSQVE